MIIQDQGPVAPVSKATVLLKEITDRKQATPSSIASETVGFSEITETLSRLRLHGPNEQESSLIDEAPGSIDSEAAIFIHPPLDEVQRMENLYLDLPAIYQESSDCSDGNPYRDIEGDLAGAPNAKKAASKPNLHPGPTRAHGPIVHLSETHRPGICDPSVSDFDGWKTYGARSVARSRTVYAINDEDLTRNRISGSRLQELLSSPKLSRITTLFQGLISERNTYVDEMEHREKAHRHLILAVEAGIDLNDAMIPFSDARLPLLVFRDQEKIKGSIDIHWCVSEILRLLSCLLCFRCDFTINWCLCYLSKLSKVVSKAERHAIFQAFLILSAFNISQQFEHVDARQVYFSSNCKVEIAKDKAHRLFGVLVFYFDPFRAPTQLESKRLPKNWSLETASTRFKDCEGSLSQIAFRLVTALRVVQRYPNTAYKFKQASPALLSVDEDVSWVYLWALASCPKDEFLRSEELRSSHGEEYAFDSCEARVLEGIAVAEGRLSFIDALFEAPGSFPENLYLLSRLSHVEIVGKVKGH